MTEPNIIVYGHTENKRGLAAHCVASNKRGTRGELIIDSHDIKRVLVNFSLEGSVGKFASNLERCSSVWH